MPEDPPRGGENVPFPFTVEGLAGVGRMPKVLLVDDDEVLLTLIQNLLADQGFSIYSTADGPRGLTMYKEHRPDLVLLDLALPSMNGLEVLKAIREFDQKARVIVVTGYGSEETAQVAFRYGATDFVLKPFEPAMLLDRLRKALQK
jgi:CheY-like chemotaxis protein